MSVFFEFPNIHTNELFHVRLAAHYGDGDTIPEGLTHFAMESGDYCQWCDRLTSVYVEFTPEAATELMIWLAQHLSVVHEVTR